jgi:hypothetical protein
LAFFISARFSAAQDNPACPENRRACANATSHLDHQFLTHIATSFFPPFAFRTAGIPAGAVDVPSRLRTLTNSKTPAGMPALQQNAANVF